MNGELTSSILFKKGGKKVQANYRGISLPSTTIILTIRIITNKINKFISLLDEQQGFRSGRSCTDAVFVIGK